MSVKVFLPPGHFESNWTCYATQSTALFMKNLPEINHTSSNLFARHWRVWGQCLSPFQGWGACLFHTWHRPEQSLQGMYRLKATLIFQPDTWYSGRNVVLWQKWPVQSGARRLPPTARRRWRRSSGSPSPRQTARQRFSSRSASAVHIGPDRHLVRKKYHKKNYKKDFKTGWNVSKYQKIPLSFFQRITSLPMTSISRTIRVCG